MATPLMTCSTPCGITGLGYYAHSFSYYAHSFSYYAHSIMVIAIGLYLKLTGPLASIFPTTLETLTEPECP